MGEQLTLADQKTVCARVTRNSEKAIAASPPFNLRRFSDNPTETLCNFPKIRRTQKAGN